LFHQEPGNGRIVLEGVERVDSCRANEHAGRPLKNGDGGGFSRRTACTITEPSLARMEVMIVKPFSSDVFDARGSQTADEGSEIACLIIGTVLVVSPVLSRIILGVLPICNKITMGPKISALYRGMLDCPTRERVECIP